MTLREFARRWKLMVYGVGLLVKERRLSRRWNVAMRLVNFNLQRYEEICDDTPVQSKVVTKEFYRRRYYYWLSSAAAIIDEQQELAERASAAFAGKQEKAMDYDKVRETTKDQGPEEAWSVTSNKGSGGTPV